MHRVGSLGPVHRFSSIVLVDSRGWILLQERDEFPEIDPEKWGFCGGHLEEGEDYVVAAYRELEEETGVHLEGGLELFEEYSFFSPTCRETDEFQLFAIRTDLTDAEIDCQEGRQIVFVDPGRARGLDLTTAATIALPAFLDSDHYRRLSA